MSEIEYTYDENLNELLINKSKRILDRFQEIILLDIKDPDLLQILEEVKDYWRDWIRPSLTSLSCEAVGGRPEIAESVSLLFTIVAAGIGIHDDIIDNSSTKHFKWTIFGTQDIEKALLIGDLLLVKGWTMVHHMIEDNIQPAVIVNIVEEYGKLCFKMCEG
jgi:geranylgeranyl pyrophosphate synthase